MTASFSHKFYQALSSPCFKERAWEHGPGPPLSIKVDTGVIHVTNWTGGPSTVARIFMLINDNSLLQTINIACIYRKREHGNLDRKYWKDKR